MLFSQPWSAAGESRRRSNELPRTKACEDSSIKARRVSDACTRPIIAGRISSHGIRSATRVSYASGPCANPSLAMSSDENHSHLCPTLGPNAGTRLRENAASLGLGGTWDVTATGHRPGIGGRRGWAFTLGQKSSVRPSPVINTGKA